MKLENIIVRFGDRTALDIARLDFERGKTYAVIGHNGCGKSTLMRCACNIIRPTEGSVSFEADDCVRYMPQHSYAFYGSTRKNILLSSTRETHAETRADYLIDQLHLSHVTQSSAKSLSGGETARMSFARTIMEPATWLMLDEPTAALDVESTLVAERLVKEYRTELNAGIILITHSLKQAQRIADYVVFMEKGCVIEQGETAACLANPKTASLARFVEIFGS